VVCPWHYGKFDLRTGQALDGVVRRPVETYRVEVRDGVVFVGVSDSQGQAAQNGVHA
jgi:3-phenylpropionate/trans-cinnamate dioxygenase ferredoxin component